MLFNIQTQSSSEEYHTAFGLSLTPHQDADTRPAIQTNTQHFNQLSETSLHASPALSHYQQQAGVLGPSYLAM